MPTYVCSRVSVCMTFYSLLLRHHYIYKWSGGGIWKGWLVHVLVVHLGFNNCWKILKHQHSSFSNACKIYLIFNVQIKYKLMILPCCYSVELINNYQVNFQCLKLGSPVRFANQSLRWGKHNIYFSGLDLFIYSWIST